MVNVRGRSKGCSTCRKRRVKCDEHRPVCRRCQRWNLDCDGPKDIAFVYATPPRPDSQASKQVSRDAIHILEEKQVPRTISQAVGLEVYICYTQRHLIPHGLIVSAISDMKPVEVLPTDLAKDNRRISHQAILSFVTILFGIQHQQKKIANQGYIMHDVALKQLNQVLSDPSRHTDEEVITAVAALAVAECLVPSGKGNYLKHMMGLQKLIELQEPSAFWPSKPYGYRDGVRFMLLLASWQLKIPCILAKDDWKTAMRINVSPEELQVQDLYDVLADSTVLLATCARIEVAWIPNDPKVEQQRDEMENRGKSLLSQLYAWKRRWDKSFEAKASRTDEHTQPQLITTPCSKGSKEIKLLLYHLVLTGVFHTLASLPHITSSRQTILQQSEANKTYLGLTSNCYAIEEHRAALEVCHCIQNYMKERAILDASTSPIVHWAIATVWSKLRYYEGSEGIWLRELLTKKGRQVISNGLWSTYKWLNSLPD